MSTDNVSYHRIIAMAIPVILANFFLPLQSIIDTAVIGHFNDSSYLAGMAIAIQVFTIIAASFNFLQYATSGLSAQAYGKQSNGNGTNDELLLILQRALAVALLLAITIMLFKDIIFNLLLVFFYAGDSSHSVAQQYLNIRVFSLIPELMNYAFIGFFVGQGKTKKILYQQLFISLTNVSLTLLLVYGLQWKIEGVAIATVIAQWLGLLFALALVANSLKVPYAKLLTIYHGLADVVELKKLFTLNINIFTRTLLLVLSFAWITQLSAQIGELVLATNIILLQVLTISSYMLDGVAVSAESLTGQCIGRNDKQGFKQLIIRTAVTSYTLAIVLSIIWMLFFPYYLTMMTNVAEVVTLGMEYKWYTVLLPVIGVGAYWIDGILFGMTEGDVIRKTSLYVTFIFLPCSWFLTQNYAVTGIWLSVWLLLLLRFGFASIGVYVQSRRRVV